MRKKESAKSRPRPGTPPTAASYQALDSVSPSVCHSSVPGRIASRPPRSAWIAVKRR
ncbi:MAG: hypothetical protein NTU94_14360 [Planctomycetota bacterium]|nr:hypothetical protein [Planctomycetota bacterium]